MPRPFAAVPNIFAPSGEPNLPQLDTNFASVLSTYNDSAIGYVSYGVDTGIANAYVVTLAAAPSAYVAGMTLAVTIGTSNTNTGASNINVNSLGNVAIRNPAGLALNGGELPAGATIPMVYDGTVFRIIGWCPLNYIATASGTVTVNCLGYSTVNVRIAWTGGGHVQLSQLGYGVPVQVQYNNNLGSTQVFSLSATTPAGTTVTAINVFASGVSGGSGAVNILAGSGSISINNSGTLIFDGALYSDNTIRMSY